jgi:hypothetical protein
MLLILREFCIEPIDGVVLEIQLPDAVEEAWLGSGFPVIVG